MKIRVQNIFLAGLSGFFLILSFPKFDFDLLAWIALVPLLIALEGKRACEAYLLSYVTGIIFITGSFYWIWVVKGYNLLDYFLLEVIYLSQFLSLFGLGLNWIRKRTGLSLSLVAPPLWVTLEYFRSHLSFLSLPWMLLGHTQYLHVPLIQAVSFTGVYGLTFLIVLVNSAVATALLDLYQRFILAAFAKNWRQFPWAPLLLSGILLTSTSFYGIFILSGRVEGEKLKIALVQGNIPQDQRWNSSFKEEILKRHITLTREAAREGPELIIWPESAVPGDILHDADLLQRVGQIAREGKAWLLVGSSENAKFTNRSLRNRYFNSLFLISPEGKIEGEYRKNILVPFGEYEPMKGIIKWPAAIAATMGNSVPGDQHTLFSLQNIPFGAVVCWEILFSDFFREVVNKGAHVVFHATNEAWFGDTAASYQLLAITVFRAAENRVAIARAGNSGITALIDPYGRITDRLKDSRQKELFVEGVLSGTVVLSDQRTFYSHYGDFFAFFQMATCVAILIHAFMKRRSPTKVLAHTNQVEGEVI